jgi:hypothetical protein
MVKSGKLFFFFFFFFLPFFLISDKEDEEDQGYFGLGFGLPITKKGGNQRTASSVSTGSDLSIYQEKKTHKNQSKSPPLHGKIPQT